MRDLRPCGKGTMNVEADQIVALYERHAHAWDLDRSRNLIERPWLDRFVSLLPHSASILDLGCGSAEPIAAYLIGHGASITGVDSSPTLISLAHARFPDQEWLVADMRKLSLGRQFHGLIAWDSFFHLSQEQQRLMFATVKEHAAPNAALMFTSGPSRGEAMGVYKGEPLYHASLDEAEYRALLSANGFGVVAHVIDDPDCGHHTVWLAQLCEPR